MALEIEGKLQQLLSPQKGTGSRGEWIKQEFIVETVEQYPRKICVSAWGDKTKELEGIQVGDTLKISINIESREYNGRWYTDVRAWRIERGNSSQQTTSAQNTGAPIPPSTDDYASFGAEEEVDDLPF